MNVERHKSTRNSHLHLFPTTRITQLQGRPPQGVHCLPPELLSSIFIECAVEWQHKSEYRFQRSAPHWVSVSYVCRYWRTTALRCPQLWSYHFFTSVEWTNELLARSEPAPLDIRFDLSRLTEDIIMASHLSVGFVLLHMSRIRVLWMRCATTHAFSFSPYLRLRAPLLESFHFEICPCSTDDVLIDREVLGKVRPNNLRHVHLDGCAVQLSSPIFHGLTRLSLYNTPRSHPRPTIVEALSVLQQMPDLQTLKLHRALSDENNMNGASSVFLPKLASVSLAGNIHCIIDLLSHLLFPHCTRVNTEYD